MSQEAMALLVETWPRGRSQAGVKENPERGRRKQILGGWNSMSKGPVLSG